jgi:lysylphosphatidylglycerol synthetase-like protein (DUF2156 family)
MQINNLIERGEQDVIDFRYACVCILAFLLFKPAAFVVVIMLSIVRPRATRTILLACCPLLLTVVASFPCCSYIIECTNAGALLPLKRVHLLGMSPTTRARYRGTTDPFGDR